MSAKNYADFSDNIQAKIDNLISSIQVDEKNYAVFDADGTLWDFDLGEVFFEYQVKNELVSVPKDPFNYYKKMKADNPKQAYLWLAQINEGIKIDLMRQWAEDCILTVGEIPFFPAIKELIERLHAKNVNVYVVTASIKWAVEPGAKRLGIPLERVIGVQTRIDNGLITPEQKGPITYREGKAKAFFYESQGESPLLAAGNTMGDFELIKTAKDIKLCLQSSLPEDELFATEDALKKLAGENAWLHHHFLK